MYSQFSFLNCLHLLSQHIFSVQWPRMHID